MTTIDLWGWKGIRLSGGRTTVVVTPEVGGRIMSLSLDGVEAFFSLPELHGRQINLRRVRDVRAEKKALGWLHYGGCKTWLSPQARWTDALPFLDLDSGVYASSIKQEASGPVVRLTSPICRETGMQFSRAIKVLASGHVSVEQMMTNRSDHEVSWGLWDVTQVGGPGQAILPIADSSQFPGGVKTYPDEGTSGETIERHVANQNGLAVIQCRETESFKYGTDSRAGWILGLLDRGPDQWLAYLKLFDAVPEGTYPHEAVVEVFDSDTHRYFELEVHSPLQHLAPGASYRFRETWILDWLPKPIDPSALREWVERHVAQDVRDG